MGDAPEFAIFRSIEVYKGKYQKSVAHQFNLELDTMTKKQSKLLCEIHGFELDVERKIEEILKDPEFEPYLKILDKFYFPLRTKARLLTRIYPFESFLLSEKKVWRERTLVEVKADRKKMVNGEEIILYRECEFKWSSRNYTRDKFKMRLGLGKKADESGDSKKRKMSKIGHLLYKEFVKEFALTE